MSSPPVAVPAGSFPPSSRYRHPGDVIRLISAGLLLAGAVVASAAAFRWLLGPTAPVPGGLGTAGPVITGLVQVACLIAAVVVVAAAGRHDPAPDRGGPADRAALGPRHRSHDRRRGAGDVRRP
jgi:hypothetical protein